MTTRPDTIFKRMAKNHHVPLINDKEIPKNDQRGIEETLTHEETQGKVLFREQNTVVMDHSEQNEYQLANLSDLINLGSVIESADNSDGKLRVKGLWKTKKETKSKIPRKRTSTLTMKAMTPEDREEHVKAQDRRNATAYRYRQTNSFNRKIEIEKELRREVQRMKLENESLENAYLAQLDGYKTEEWGKNNLKTLESVVFATFELPMKIACDELEEIIDSHKDQLNKIETEKAAILKRNDMNKKSDSSTNGSQKCRTNKKLASSQVDLKICRLEFRVAELKSYGDKLLKLMSSQKLVPSSEGSTEPRNQDSMASISGEFTELSMEPSGETVEDLQQPGTKATALLAHTTLCPKRSQEFMTHGYDARPYSKDYRPNWSEVTPADFNFGSSQQQLEHTFLNPSDRHGIQLPSSTFPPPASDLSLNEFSFLATPNPTPEAMEVEFLQNSATPSHCPALHLKSRSNEDDVEFQELVDYVLDEKLDDSKANFENFKKRCGGAGPSLPDLPDDFLKSSLTPPSLESSIPSAGVSASGASSDSRINLLENHTQHIPMDQTQLDSHVANHDSSRIQSAQEQQYSAGHIAYPGQQVPGQNWDISNGTMGMEWEPARLYDNPPSGSEIPHGAGELPFPGNPTGVSFQMNYLSEEYAPINTPGDSDATNLPPDGQFWNMPRFSVA
ncbi:hypothetical protein GCK72_011711 [Caenorhabditis remanei]|uniref:BZIP domain-containing protein n=1 Tax=Caenorhabditis remanei TaxID=31234 RepID=A0A6A5H8I6_CAERE|nr:hypothetical protein GCK72_011711 [Caenorhabditis remanei]KAF1763445.1 hypothetical protein GCK72_011711 [Caenorhabditis remanei]